MKLKSILTIAALALGISLHATAAEKHDHAHAAKAGPTGGRLITEVEPHAEFFVNKDKKIEIRFVDDDNKVVAPAAQTVTVIMGERSAPTKLAFTKVGDKLISDKAIPEGKALPTIVQIKADPKAKSITEKFNLDLSGCPTCDHPEYACICEHAGAGHDKKDAHDHDKK